MGVDATQVLVCARRPRPPQKFGQGPLFLAQLLSRNHVLHKNQGEPLLCNLFRLYNLAQSGRVLM